MFSTTDLISFILAFVVLYLALSFFSKLRREDKFNKRLQDLMVYKESLLKKETTTSKAFKRLETNMPFLRNLIAKIEDKETGAKENLKVKFDKAGIRSSNATLMYGLAKILFVFPLAGIAAFIVFKYTTFPIYLKIICILVAGLLGSYLVDIILRIMVSSRQDRILKAFPEALDLMVICTESGLSLTATIQRVAREISQLSPDLGYELALLSIELNMLTDRQKALRNFSNRLESNYFKSIISNIAQAEQYGTPIAQTMRIISEEFRGNRLLKAEEKASRLPALLSLPMMIFIFPCIYLIILGPAIINVIEHFNK